MFLVQYSASLPLYSRYPCGDQSSNTPHRGVQVRPKMRGRLTVGLVAYPANLDERNTAKWRTGPYQAPRSPR